MTEIERFQSTPARTSEVVRVDGELVTRADLRNAATDSWTSVLAEVGQLASVICETDMVPKDIRGNVGATSGRVLYGREVGLGPMQALTQLHNVEGKVGMSAEAMRALVLQQGHEVAVVESTSQTCTLQGKRRGSEAWSRVTWTLDDARRAKLTAKFNWTAYPRQMLVARATAELCRLIFPDVIHGLAAVEEFDDVMLVGGQPTVPAIETGGTEAAPKKTVQRKPKPKAENAPTPEIPVPAAPTAPESAAAAPVPDVPPPAAPTPKGGGADGGEAVAPPPPPEPEAQPGEEPASEEHAPEPMATKLQVTKMVTVFNSLGVKDREERLYICGVLGGRVVESANHLTKAEASTIIDSLERCESNDDLQQVVNHTAEHQDGKSDGAEQ